MIQILKASSDLGWNLVASLDVSAKYIHQENGPDYPIDVHSWYLTNNPATSPGSEPIQAPSALYPDIGGGGFSAVSAPPSYFDAVQS